MLRLVARLLNTPQEEAEVAHEALIREWPTLRQWLDENREWLRLHRRLTETAREWEKLAIGTGWFFREARQNAARAQELVGAMGDLLDIELAQNIENVRKQVAVLLVQRGEEYAKNGDREQAANNFQTALLLNPPPDTPVYVWIPPGEFTMGSGGEDLLALDNEKPQHTVNLEGFWIMRTEVTNAQFARCVEAGACSEPSNSHWNDVDYANHPVTNVTWHQANTYATWVGGRLPSEAQWEKACRGTDGRIYPWGNEEPTDQLLNYTIKVGDTMPVGSYPEGASPYGVLDMAGNVWEWTSSLYQAYPYDPTDGREDPEATGGRVLCGGSFDVSGNFVRGGLAGASQRKPTVSRVIEV